MVVILASQMLRALRCLACMVVLTPGCKRRDSDEPGQPMTALQADAAVSRAIRQSPEGFIFFPSKKAEVVYELPRLNEIAQSMRQPAAGCFLERAVQTMRADATDDAGFVGVPDGQVKLRIRISPGGKVLRSETLESGFDDETVPDCVARELQRRRFPENQTGTNHYIDVIYWVSLGAQPGRADTRYAQRVRREQTEAGVRAKKCLQGRVTQGRYSVAALNLVARNGVTVANRVEQTELSGEVRQCLATAFRAVRLPSDDTTFIRPVQLDVAFDVRPDGSIGVRDEEWLRLVKLEERARRAVERADLLAEGGDPKDAVAPELIDEGEPDLSALEGADGLPAGPQAPPAQEPPAVVREDPGKGGLRLDIGPRRNERP